MRTVDKQSACWPLNHIEIRRCHREIANLELPPVQLNAPTKGNDRLVKTFSLFIYSIYVSVYKKGKLLFTQLIYISRKIWALVIQVQVWVMSGVRTPHACAK